MNTPKKYKRRPLQDRLTARWWIDALKREADQKGYQKMYVYNKFIEMMIAAKFKIELWQIEYIAELLEYKKQWAQIKFENLYPQHK